MSGNVYLVNSDLSVKSEVRHYIPGAFESIYSGGNHTMLLKSDGSLWTTGYNALGQLGDGTTADKTSFTLFDK